MSIRLMSVIWEIKWPTQGQLLIALKLADYANDLGDSIYPSRATLADQTQCSESTVKSVLRCFRDVGLLAVTREGGHGPKSTTHYAFDVRLLYALHSRTCELVGGSETLVLNWLDKGSEIDPNKEHEKGSEIDPLNPLRGQPERLRGQPDHAKGSAPIPQPFTTHQKEPPEERERACDVDASSPRFEARLVLKSDREWKSWINFVEREDDARSADAFVKEGGMVVFSEKPTTGCPRPKLPPPASSKRWEELALRRPPDALTERSRRMMGEVAK